jgi:hypothetical protein
MDRNEHFKPQYEKAGLHSCRTTNTIYGNYTTHNYNNYNNVVSQMYAYIVPTETVKFKLVLFYLDDVGSH